jgi:hypothetical protein
MENYQPPNTVRVVPKTTNWYDDIIVDDPPPPDSDLAISQRAISTAYAESR